MPEPKDKNREPAKELVATIRIEGTDEAVSEIKKLISEASVSATKLAILIGKINARCR